MEKIQKIEHSLSIKSLITLIVVGALIFLAWQLSWLLIIIITAVMLAATLDPFVQFFHKKLSLTLSAFIVMIILVAPVVTIIITMIPTLLDQFSNISKAVTDIFNTYSFLPKIFHNIDFSQYTKEGGQYLLQSTTVFTSFVFQLIILLVLTFYLLIDAGRIYKIFSILIPKKNKKITEEALNTLSEISGHYIRGNLLTSLICTVLIFIGLTALDVPNALPLAIFTGILDLMPLIGSTVAEIPAVILAFTISPFTGIATIALYSVYQQVENYLLAPNIYRKTLNLVPFLSFTAVLIGSSLFGIPGAFLALPIAASVPTLFDYYHNLKDTDSK